MATAPVTLIEGRPAILLDNCTPASKMLLLVWLPAGGRSPRRRRRGGGPKWRRR